MSREPDFRNLEAVLEKREPKRPTLFEFFMNERVYTALSGMAEVAAWDDLTRSMRLAAAFTRAGYDYVTLMCPWTFPLSQPARTHRSHSLNHPSRLADRKAFDAYAWPDPGTYDYGYLKRLEDALPRGMGVLMCGPDGVLETATELVGYENLCLMLYDDPEFADMIFERIGGILLDFYTRVLEYPAVRGIISSDDWGFHTQTLISPAQLRRYVFPWHARFVGRAHEKGRYAILHSCGVYRPVLHDIVEVMHFDARHSYEDKIVPVEDAYEELRGRIAVLGGIDVDFLARRTPEEIFARAAALIQKTGCRGYALGSGNSIPDYVPDVNYFAMLRAAGIEIA